MLTLRRRDLLAAGAGAAALYALPARAANLHQFLKAAIEHSASELLITTGSPPQLRIDGETVPLKTDVLTPTDVKQLVYSVLLDAQKAQFEKDNRVRISFGVKELSRFRLTAYAQRGAVAATFKPIPYKVPPLDPALNVLAPWAKATAGLHIVSGKPDSGRTTAVAELVDKINVDRHGHLLTIEDPIEFLQPHKNSLVEQIELGTDFPTPAEGVRRAIGASIDVVAWDMEQNHPPEFIELAESGAMVIAVVTAPDPAGVADLFGAKKKLIVGHAHLTLSSAAPKKPRKLSVQVVA